jgi:CxxC motif-containing protein (DUF1111 family)
MKTQLFLLTAAVSMSNIIQAVAAPALPPPPAIKAPLKPTAPPATAAGGIQPSPPAQPNVPPRSATPTPPGLPIANSGKFANPIQGLSSAELAEFNVAKNVFLEVESAEAGLGPIFNDVSCVACHFRGGAGGASRTAVTHFGKVTNGVFDPLSSLGGPLLQRRATAQKFLERIPREANVVANRITTPLFGAGLVEAIPDATIQSLAAQSKPDGVRGRLSVVRDAITGITRIGRFGWKAQHASLNAFSADAYLNEMGVTNEIFPRENAPNGNALLLAESDKISDPEDITSTGNPKPDFILTADYMRLLAAVPRATANASIIKGETVFKEIGCAVCHVPSLKTGTSPIAALSTRAVDLYSDLLLHDMGALGDGIPQGSATAAEMRTAPLWGLRLRDAFLHDGRASTAELAVLAHAGEGKIARDRFAKLTADRKKSLLDFLGSL